MILPALENMRTAFGELAGGLNGSIELLDATPRRLVLMATGLQEQLADVQQVIPGPYVSAGAKAAEGFARKTNTTVDALQKDADAKGERYFFAAV
ncbi:MAG: glycine--tRNA ligase subunit beta, partial [Acidobacteriaceae bacterium]|nr:glycine--tRNA ligase subunit beta [Acidobacteriaceae bacterium]